MPAAGVAEAELEDYRWLVSPEACDYIETAEAQHDNLLAAAAALRGALSAERVHLILQLTALRRKAKVKFTHAERMFFTQLGLEQATDEVLATYKAAQFPNGPVIDFCCGIGGDLLALAARGETLGVDRNPVAGLLAEANCTAVAPEYTARVITAEIAPQMVLGCAAWHIDPDRRPRGTRTTAVELHEPGPELINQLLALQPNGAIKLAPAAQLPEHWSEQAELEWISRGRECRQLVAWFGGLAKAPGMRRATMLGKTAGDFHTLLGTPDVPIETAKQIDRFLFEPDPAVLAAKLTGALAADLGLKAIAPGIAYLAGDRPLRNTALSCFEVQEVMPYRAKRIKALLKARGIGRLEVKKRGVDHDPEQVRRELQTHGEQAATLLLTRIQDSVVSILARRVTADVDAEPIDRA